MTEPARPPPASAKSPAPANGPAADSAAAPATDADAEFLRRFEARAIPRSEWHHRSHLRVAYAYLSRHALEEAMSRIRDGIRALNAANGVVESPEHGYHETLTQMWMRVLHGLRTSVGPEADFDRFVERHPYVLEKYLGRLFYSRERMMSAEARARYLEPDLTPFPGSARRG